MQMAVSNVRELLIRMHNIVVSFRPHEPHKKSSSEQGEAN
jgi:hypothetical protein